MCLRTLVETADVDVLVVDDDSPRAVDTYGVVKPYGEMHWRSKNGGFSASVNVGLRRALELDVPAVLVNSDIEFTHPGWLEAMEGTEGASVVGALLLYPFGLVQHAGAYFSTLNRGWHHRFHFSPPDLDDLQLEVDCPCTAALQLIYPDTLGHVGLYDERFPLSFEDVDFALRVFNVGRRCVYQPKAVAVHHEHATRGTGEFSDKELLSWHHLSDKHKDTDVSRWECPPW